MPAGLKEGGHHRREIDLALAKKEAKLAAKVAQEVAGRLTLTLTRTLLLDPEVDVYLEADDNAGEPVRAPCMDHFWREGCKNRRCPLSHAHTLHGVCPVVSTSLPEHNTAAHENGIPALVCVPGLHGNADAFFARNSSVRRRPVLEIGAARPEPTVDKLVSLLTATDAARHPEVAELA